MEAHAEFRANPKRILVRGVNWLGDAVMTTPALTRLRERFPQAHICIYTQGKLAELWQHHPAIDEVMVPEAKAGLRHVGRQLRNGAFDLAVILPNSSRSAIEPWMADIPIRLGYGLGGRRLLLTHCVSRRPGHVPMRKRSVAEVEQLARDPSQRSRPVRLAPTAHQVHDYLHLVAALGADAAICRPSLAVTEAEVAAVRQKFRLPEGATICGINPGAEYGPAKRWPATSFLKAAAAVQRERSCLWLVFGGKGDAELARSITEGINQPTRRSGSDQEPSAVNLAAKTSLRELMALLKLCRVLVTNDTGPMHVAAALNTPVVVPFGSTSPELTGPGLPGDGRHRLLQTAVPCSPCFLKQCPIDFRCMQSITPEQVSRAVLACLNEPG